MKGKKVRPCDMGDTELVNKLLYYASKATQKCLEGEEQTDSRGMRYSPEGRYVVVLKRELMKRLRERKK